MLRMLALSTLIGCTGICKANIPLYKDRKAETPERVKDLLSRMTLDEKIAELNLVPYFSDQDAKIRQAIRNGEIGALLKANGTKLNRSLQEEAIKHSRLGIPLMFHEDVIHGYRTLSPIPLAESCSWDTALVARSAQVAAEEASAAGLQLTYAPMVDISNDPRWGRIMETSGEDAFLGAAMAEARVKGFQGNSLADTKTVAACVKHFAGYGALLAGRDYQNTDFSYRDLMERYIVPFQAAIDAGVASVMCSYTSYDGEPVTMNKFMNTELLRNRMKFRGLFMSDWTTLNNAVTEGAAIDGREASQRAINSGLGMDMSSWQYSKWLKKLVLAGEVDSTLINRAAYHALYLKFQVGLFDNPYLYFDETREKQTLGAEHIRKAAYDMACASMVLLKNDKSTLPIKDNGKIALVGPYVSLQQDLMGSWTMMGKSKEVVSVLEGFRKQVGEGNIIDASCKWDEITDQYIEKIIPTLKDASVIVACIGEASKYIGEAVSTGKLEVPQEQIKLLKSLKATGKPVVAVLFNGRPLVVNDILENCDALLEAWYPGTMGGEAVAALLTGKEVPSGKLTQTFPRHAGQVPTAYNFRRTFVKVEHADLPSGPQFPFGYGLSYTTFKYSKPSTDRTEYTEGDRVRVKLSVTNTGKVKAREIVQLYIRDEVATVIPREKELKGFRSVVLHPGETKEIVFDLPDEAFKVYNNRMQKVLEPGKFKIMTGSNSVDLKETVICFK